MSIDATRWAWQQRHITTTQKILLLSMADRAGEDHTCWPSLARLCADTGLSDRAVQKAMTETLKAALIKSGLWTDDWQRGTVPFSSNENWDSPQNRVESLFTLFAISRYSAAGVK